MGNVVGAGFSKGTTVAIINLLSIAASSDRNGHSSGLGGNEAGVRWLRLMKNISKLQRIKAESDVLPAKMGNQKWD